MDGTHGGDSWEPFFQIVSHADQIWNGRPFSFLVVAIAIVFYTLAGTKWDLLFNVAILALLIDIKTIVRYLSALSLCLLVALGIYFATASRNNSTTSSWPGPRHPYLIPCRTTHRRLFPVEHSFSYSYLTVGVPVGYKGNLNGMLSVDEPRRSMFSLTKLWSSWYRVDASDYLQRDCDELSLRGKLDKYLQSEGAQPKDFQYAYLITAARFLGYHFNPVSFWYLYSPDKTLAAMVLEVNNTYDERRPYLVLRDATHQLDGQQPRIKSTQKKDFHVSPFNSREGHYSVMSNDPLGAGMNGFCGLNITITLNSSKGHPKIVTRLISEVEAIDPLLLTPLSKVKFLAEWFWVGFATMPRIVKEAVVLMYRRKLNVLEKPMPVPGTLGRHSSSVEKTLQACFGRYLQFLIHQSGKRLKLKYYKNGLLSATPIILISPDATEESEVLEIRVLTPTFHSNLIHYDETLDGMKTELDEKKTIWINNPELLAYLFTKTSMVVLPFSDSGVLFMELINHLCGRRGSSMDRYILSCETWALRRRYLWVLIRQWVADYYFGGREEPLSLAIYAIRIGIAWVTTLSLMRVMTAIYD